MKNRLISFALATIFSGLVFYGCLMPNKKKFNISYPLFVRGSGTNDLLELTFEKKLAHLNLTRAIHERYEHDVKYRLDSDLSGNYRGRKMEIVSYGLNGNSISTSYVKMPLVFGFGIRENGLSNRGAIFNYDKSILQQVYIPLDTNNFPSYIKVKRYGIF